MTGADVSRHTLRTPGGDVRAGVVVRATEAFTAALHGSWERRLHRALVPVYSLIVATDVLPQMVWDEIGWSGAETIADGRHTLIYAQRTADGRIVLGGRGALYNFGSRRSGSLNRCAGSASTSAGGSARAPTATNAGAGPNPGSGSAPSRPSPAETLGGAQAPRVKGSRDATPHP